MTWTRFMDMCSGGSSKEDWSYIYIEAPEAEARSIFYSRFGHSPDRVTCTCCGEDYSVTESETLAEASAHDRSCAGVYFYKDDGAEAVSDPDRYTDFKWGTTTLYKGREVEFRYVEREGRGGIFGHGYMTVDEYADSPGVLVIPASSIAPEESRVSVPEQGYIWHD